MYIYIYTYFIKTKILKQSAWCSVVLGDGNLSALLDDMNLTMVLGSGNPTLVLCFWWQCIDSERVYVSEKNSEQCYFYDRFNPTPTEASRHYFPNRRWRTRRYSTIFVWHTCHNNDDWLVSREDKPVAMDLPSVGVSDRLPRGEKTSLLMWKVSRWRINIGNSPIYHRCWLNSPKQHANIKYSLMMEVIRRYRPTSLLI